jgi:hypothetical protein
LIAVERQGNFPCIEDPLTWPLAATDVHATKKTMTGKNELLLLNTVLVNIFTGCEQNEKRNEQDRSLTDSYYPIVATYGNLV